MQSLLSRLIPELRARFPDRAFAPGSQPDRAVVYPAQHPEVGAIEIMDDGDELTIYLGTFTHCHMSNYDDAPEEEKAKEIVESTVAFLGEIFGDRVVFWGSHKDGGGTCHVSIPNRYPAGQRLFVWSGPYSAG